MRTVSDKTELGNDNHNIIFRVTMNFLNDNKWFLLGYFGSSNTGDEAILNGFLLACDPELLNRMVILTKAGTPTAVTSKFGVKTVPAKPWPVLRELWRSHGVILAGGGHFQDDFRTWRYIRHFRYMARYVAIFLLARFLRKRVLWLSMGIGPFFRQPTKWITKLGLWACDYVTVRDSLSKQEVLPWISPNKLDLTFDIAVLLKQECEEVIEAIKIQRDQANILGISVTPVDVYKTGGPHVNKIFWNRCCSALIRMLEYKPDFKIRIFIIKGGDRETDIALSHEFYNRLAQAAPERIELIPYHPDPSYILQKISECRAFIATRLHSAILAYSVECDLMLFEYHKKVRFFSHEIELPEHACIAINATVTEQVLYRRIWELLDGDIRYKPNLPVSEASKRALLNFESINKYS